MGRRCRLLSSDWKSLAAAMDFCSGNATGLYLHSVSELHAVRWVLEHYGPINNRLLVIRGG
jgi:hypothetical protein